MHNSPFIIHNSRKAQVMLLAILALGGVILVGTTAAGLLVIYQIRQSADLASSAKAVFAADSGIEWGLYQFFKPGSGTPPSFSNGASVTVVCYTASRAAVPCTDPSVASIRAVGKSGNVSRAFEQSL